LNPLAVTLVTRLRAVARALAVVSCGIVLLVFFGRQDPWKGRWFYPVIGTLLLIFGIHDWSLSAVLWSFLIAGLPSAAIYGMIHLSPKEHLTR
jgi:hypothetical protein